MGGRERVVAVIGGILDGARAERERLERAGARLVAAAGGSDDEVIASCAGAEVVMCLGQQPFTERVFASLPELAFLMQCSVGYDCVDLEAATRHGVVVAHSPDFCTEEVAEHAAMLILACVRKLPQQLDACRRHGWSRPAAVAAMGAVYRLAGRTLGFVGFGRIARRVAERLRGFALTLLACDPYLGPADVASWGVGLVPLEELCRRSDVISVHTPLGPGTRHLLGEREFRAMKPTAFLVNTSRGGTVDEAALVRALREGWIAGAALDVLAQEPPPRDHPLLGMPQVLLTPHTAGHGEEAMAENRRDSVEEVLRFLGGEWPRHCLNPSVRSHARASRLR